MDAVFLLLFLLLPDQPLEDLLGLHGHLVGEDLVALGGRLTFYAGVLALTVGRQDSASGRELLLDPLCLFDFGLVAVAPLCGLLVETMRQLNRVLVLIGHLSLRFGSLHVQRIKRLTDSGTLGIPPLLPVRDRGLRVF